MTVQFKDITEFAVFLWGDSISAAQLCLLRVLYGLPLDRDERALWRRFAGKGFFARYSAREYSECVAILGRQSGKSSRIGVTVSLFEALCVPRSVPSGSRVAVEFFTPTIRQSTFDQVADKLRSVPELSEFIESDTSAAGEIRLTNGVDLVSISANPRTARGRASILVVVDEAAFIRTDSSFECNLPELLESIRPSLVVWRGKLLLLSSPAGREGILFDAWESREANADAVMCWRAPSQEMNPSIDPALLKKERARGESYYAREYLAEFVESAMPFLPEEALTAAVVKGIPQFAPDVSDEAVFAGIDLADRRDDCALSISAVRNSEGKRRAVLLFSKLWKAGKDGHNVMKVLEEMGTICQRYRVSDARGDQKSMSTAEHILSRYGVSFKRVISEGAGSESGYRLFLAALNNDEIRLIDSEETLSQLRRLEEKIDDGGRFLVRGRRGGKDDAAVSTVLSSVQAIERLVAPTEPWFQIVNLYDPD